MYSVKLYVFFIRFFIEIVFDGDIFDIGNYSFFFINDVNVFVLYRLLWNN